MCYSTNQRVTKSLGFIFFQELAFSDACMLLRFSISYVTPRLFAHGIDPSSYDSTFNLLLKSISVRNLGGTPCGLTLVRLQQEIYSSFSMVYFHVDYAAVWFNMIFLKKF